MDGMYKKSGMMSIGIGDDVIITDTLLNSLRYVFKTIFQPRGNITVIIPEQIIFWSNSEIPDEFQFIHRLVSTISISSATAATRQGYWLCSPARLPSSSGCFQCRRRRSRPQDKTQPHAPCPCA